MNPIYISKEDHHTISALVTASERRQRESNPFTEKLKGELARAILMDGSAIPERIVKLYSKVSLRNLETDALDVWTLTLPQDADAENGKLSVLAPIGSAIIGFGEGDAIEWETPGGICRMRIESVVPGKKEPSPYLFN